MCNTKFGLTGDSCNEYCSHGISIIIINCIVALIASLLLIISSFLLRRFRKHRKEQRMDSVSLTLTFVILATFFQILSSIVNLLVVTGFPSLFVVNEEAGRYIRRSSQSLEYVNNTLFALTSCFAVGAIVVLPLTWVRLIIFITKNTDAQTDALDLFSYIQVDVSCGPGFHFV
jgi:4-amino-4-deoxy-L-arabinose transferase-like glycosyltransferase